MKSHNDSGLPQKENLQEMALNSDLKGLNAR